MEDKKTMTVETLDDYCRENFASIEDFEGEVREMDAHSVWTSGLPTSEFSLEPVFPIEANETARKYHLDADVLYETAQEGNTQLLLTLCGKAFPVRDCAITSLCEAAKLFGSALGRMTKECFSETLNYGFEVAQGNSMVLMRYGKLAAVHSDGTNGYEIMPISALLEATLDELHDRFGEVKFVGGFNSHSYTEGMFELPDAQMYLNMVYQDALDAAKSKSMYNVDFMPVVRFCSSDTSNACATLQPMFAVHRDRPVRLCDGVKIKHSRKGMAEGQTGLDLYKKEIQTIYAKFEDSAAAVKRLAGITLYHPENVVVGLCRKFGIPKRYGTAAYEEIEMLRGGQEVSMIAHDVFLAMSAATASAVEKGASRVVINTIDEAVSRIAQIEDWSEFDVAGTVAWKD